MSLDKNTLRIRIFPYGGFDPGSGLTLAACLSHASRAGVRDEPSGSTLTLAADGGVTRG